MEAATFPVRCRKDPSIQVSITGAHDSHPLGTRGSRLWDKIPVHLPLSVSRWYVASHQGRAYGGKDQQRRSCFDPGGR